MMNIYIGKHVQTSVSASVKHLHLVQRMHIQRRR